MKRRLIRAIPEHGYEIETITKEGKIKVEVVPIDKTKMRMGRMRYEIMIGGSWWTATQQEYDTHKET